jgi:hypothetical protein
VLQFVTGGKQHTGVFMQPLFDGLKTKHACLPRKIIRTSCKFYRVKSEEEAITLANVT